MKKYAFIILFLFISMATHGQSEGEEDCGASCYCLLEKGNREAANLDYMLAINWYKAAKLCYQSAGKQDSILVVDNQMLQIFGQLQQLRVAAEKEQAKVKKSTEAGLLSTLNEAGTTYYDFGKKNKKDEYLVYPPSPNDIFIAFGIANRIKLKAFPNILSTDIVSSSLEVVDSDALLPITLGYWYQHTPNISFSAQLQYQQQQLLETIEAQEAVSQEQYQIHRYMDMDAVVFMAGGGKSFRNFNVYVGLESTYLNTQYQPISTFVFSDQEALETVLPDAPISDLADNQIDIEQEQVRVGASYLNLSVCWQLSYRLPIGDNFFLGLQANNILPVDPSLLFRLTNDSSSSDSLWEDLYAIDYDAIRAKSINYLQVQLGYHFNREKRIKSRLKLY